MECDGDEIGVADYMQLMKAFLERRLTARDYAKQYFDLTKGRVNISNEDANRITQQAYGDADDYEPTPRFG